MPSTSSSFAEGFPASSSMVLTGEGIERPGIGKGVTVGDSFQDPPKHLQQLGKESRWWFEVGEMRKVFAEQGFSDIEPWTDLCPLLSSQAWPMVEPFIRASKTNWRSRRDYCKDSRLFSNRVGSRLRLKGYLYQFLQFYPISSISIPYISLLAMLTHILLGIMHFWEIKGDFYHL